MSENFDTLTWKMLSMKSPEEIKKIFEEMYPIADQRIDLVEDDKLYTVCGESCILALANDRSEKVRKRLMSELLFRRNSENFCDAECVEKLADSPYIDVAESLSHNTNLLKKMWEKMCGKVSIP